MENFIHRTEKVGYSMILTNILNGTENLTGTSRTRIEQKKVLRKINYTETTLNEM